MDKQTLLLLLRVASGMQHTHDLWCVYVTKGPAEFEAFIDTGGKAWQWTMRTYPEVDARRCGRVFSQHSLLYKYRPLVDLENY